MSTTGLGPRNRTNYLVNKSLLQDPGAMALPTAFLSIPSGCIGADSKVIVYNMILP